LSEGIWNIRPGLLLVDSLIACKNGWAAWISALALLFPGIAEVEAAGSLGAAGKHDLLEVAERREPRPLPGYAIPGFAS
jgi:hypothetical protein